MAKRQNFVVGSTNQITESLSNAELNHGWDEFDVLTAEKLDGVMNAVSDYSNDSSNEIANAIQALTGSQPTGSSNTELAGALQKMRTDIETSSLTFKGYIAANAPSSNDYDLQIGNIWIQSATLPTVFPVAIAGIWDGTQWETTTDTYTQKDFDFFRNINDNEGYYWFGGQWTVMSTDMDTNYFQLNAQGKWTIKNIADASLSNLTDAGKNIPSWSLNTSDCLTEVPQNINLSVSNYSSTITLKAGSKVYVPNGADVFTPIVTDNDISFTSTATTDYYAFLFYVNGSLILGDINDVKSGTVAPTNGYFYNKTTNDVSYYENSVAVWSGGSLPLALVQVRQSSLDLLVVYNSLTWMGTVVFALPGIKGLAPDGRNPDGTLKSVSIEITAPILYDTYGYGGDIYFVPGNNPYLKFAYSDRYGSFYYDEQQNIQFWGEGNPWVKVNWLRIGTLDRYDTSGDPIATNLVPKQPFRAFGFADMLTVLEALYPVGALFMTTARTGIQRILDLMPWTRWEKVEGGRALWTATQYQDGNTTIAAGLPNISGDFVANNATGSTGSANGAFSVTANATGRGWDGNNTVASTYKFSAQDSNSIYGNSTTVQPPAYTVQVWRRIA